MMGVRSAFAPSKGHRRASLMLVAALLVAALSANLSAAASAATLTRAFADDVWFDGTIAGVTAQNWFAKTRATGAKLVEIEVDWVGVEPTPPAPGTNPASPAAVQFDFSTLDQRVEQFSRSGLQSVLLVTDAPRWAMGSGGTPDEYATGGYEPNPTALGQLARALATRYSGRYADPLHPGHKLPRVTYFQAWAEANMTTHLSPQWIKSNGRWINAGPGVYRNMLNAFYAGVHAGDPRDKVIASGLESYGDPPGTGLDRTPPVTFLENMFCLDSRLTRTSCAGPSHFDVLASDPYDVGGPTVHAFSSLDASAPDLARLTRVANAAVKARTALPTKPKPLWVTEFSYESDPPNRFNRAISAARQARWLEQSFYIFANEGVSTVFWYLVRDQPPPYSVNYASGVYFLNGKPKPSFTAYKFPFVVAASGRQAQIWGLTPASGTVMVQRLAGRSWKTVTTFVRGAQTIFSRYVPSLPRGQYRAVVHGQKSLVWTF